MLIYTANDNSTKYLYGSKHFLTSLGISLGLSTYFWPMGMKVIYGSSRTRHLRNGVPLNLFFPPQLWNLEVMNSRRWQSYKLEETLPKKEKCLCIKLCRLEGLLSQHILAYSD